MLPSEIFGNDLVAWYFASNTQLHPTDGKVSAWYDASGNGHTIGQTTSARRPTYTDRNMEWGSRPTVNFDADAEQWLESGEAATTWKFLSDGTASGVIIVCRATASPGVAIATSDGPGAGMALSYDSGDLRGAIVDGVDNTVSAEATHAPGQIEWIALTYDEGRLVNEWDLLINGASVDSGDSSNPPGAGDPIGFAVGAGVGGAGPFHGEIAEIIVFTGYLSGTTLAQVTEYLQANYFEGRTMKAENRNMLTGPATALHSSGRVRKVTDFSNGYDVLANSATGKDPNRWFTVIGDITGKTVEFVDMSGETITLDEDDLALDSFPYAVKSFTDNTNVDAIHVAY